MERVAFLIEQTGQRLSALLNPNTLILRRQGGVRTRPGTGGQITGAGLADDPVLYTGGGKTELELDLLFDLSLLDPSATVQDVRELTLPLWNLAENGSVDPGYGRPPLVRFIWGKAWNVRGVIAALAERLEEFSPEGAAQRSWLRMRLLRVNEAPAAPATGVEMPAIQELPVPAGPVAPGALPEEMLVHQTTGGGVSGEPGGTPGERLDMIAFNYYGSAAFWRMIASFNHLDDPSAIPAGTLLQIPPLASGGATA